MRHAHPYFLQNQQSPADYDAYAPSSAWAHSILKCFVSEIQKGEIKNRIPP